MIKSSKTKYYLTAVYPVPGQFGMVDKLDAKLEKTIGERGASGSGFGERDLAWYDLTKDAAEKKAGKLKALKVKAAVKAAVAAETAPTPPAP